MIAAAWLGIAVALPWAHTGVVHAWATSLFPCSSSVCLLAKPPFPVQITHICSRAECVISLAFCTVAACRRCHQCAAIPCSEAGVCTA
jgi:hypothetical protein